jgi:crotonobetainyl-CoA:carnitine CoA-transferase CaiB-like acyl-CoA transferase
VIVEGQAGDNLEGFSFVIDDQGLELLQDQGWNAEWVAGERPDLIHASVSTFGSGNERSRWQGGELVASAMGGTFVLLATPSGGRKEA